MITHCLISAALTIGAIQPGPAAPAKSAPAPGKPDAAAVPDPAKPLVPFPHPLITEVLYNVPVGDAGDANKDGARQVAGDEFVEVINPHDKPISIGGYALSDMTAQEKTGAGKPKSGAVRWTFPPLTLKPGQVVVVFNGHASTIAGAVGDSSSAPGKPNDKFADAAVFSMRQPSDRTAFANTDDWVLLTAPGGQAVQLVTWGKPRVKPPADVLLVEEAPAARNASVQRTASNGPLAAHPDNGGVSFSPGRFAMPTPPEKSPEKPTQPADAAPPQPEKTEPVAPGKPSERARKPKF